MFIKIIIAVVIAVISSGFYTAYADATIESFYSLDYSAMAAFTLATVLTVLLNAAATCLCNRKKGGNNTGEANTPAQHEGDREQGTVKWFNVSKGFGFITRENGEDIFVHYRSIRGQGRRRLFDGQGVSFYIIDSEKGLQADDVDVEK